MGLYSCQWLLLHLVVHGCTSGQPPILPPPIPLHSSSFWGMAFLSFPSLGISIVGQRNITLHHADDVSVYLSSLSPQAESDLQFAHTCFQHASCQAVHLGKSKALILKTSLPHSPSPPSSFATIPLTTSLTSLGIPRSTPSPPPSSPPPSSYNTRSSLQPPISPSPPSIPPSQTWSQA